MLWTLSFSFGCLASCIIPVKMESEMMTIHFSSVPVSLNSTSTYVYQSTDLPQQTTCSDTAEAENGTETQTNKTECQMVTIGSIGSTAVYSPYWRQLLQVKNWYKYGSPILIVVGTVGNFLSIVTLQSRLFKSSSTSFILTMLAVCEILLLYVRPAEKLRSNSFQCQHPKLFGLRMQVSRFPDLLYPSVASWTLIFLTAEEDHIGVFPVQVQTALQSETHRPRLDGRRHTPGSGRRSVLSQRWHSEDDLRNPVYRMRHRSSLEMVHNWSVVLDRHLPLRSHPVRCHHRR